MSITALVVKWISQRSSEPLLRVRIPPRAPERKNQGVLKTSPNLKFLDREDIFSGGKL